MLACAGISLGRRVQPRRCPCTGVSSRDVAHSKLVDMLAAGGQATFKNTENMYVTSAWLIHYDETKHEWVCRAVGSQ